MFTTLARSATDVYPVTIGRVIAVIVMVYGGAWSRMLPVRSRAGLESLVAGAEEYPATGLSVDDLRQEGGCVLCWLDSMRAREARLQAA